MFRILGRLLLSLFALLALRMIFAAARRAHRVDGAGRPDPDRGVGRAKEPERATAGSHRPRIDTATAEDVPYVEVAPETARRG